MELDTDDEEEALVSKCPANGSPDMPEQSQKRFIRGPGDIYIKNEFYKENVPQPFDLDFAMKMEKQQDKLLQMRGHVVKLDHNYSGLTPNQYQERMQPLVDNNAKLKMELSKARAKARKFKYKLSQKQKSTQFKEMKKTIDDHLKTIQKLENKNKLLEEKVFEFDYS